jgi:hypothetical protein
MSEKQLETWPVNPPPSREDFAAFRAAWRKAVAQQIREDNHRIALTVDQLIEILQYFRSHGSGAEKVLLSHPDGTMAVTGTDPEGSADDLLNCIFLYGISIDAAGF